MLGVQGEVAEHLHGWHREHLGRLAVVGAVADQQIRDVHLERAGEAERRQLPLDVGLHVGREVDPRVGEPAGLAKDTAEVQPFSEHVCRELLGLRVQHRGHLHLPLAPGNLQGAGRQRVALKVQRAHHPPEVERQPFVVAVHPPPDDPLAGHPRVHHRRVDRAVEVQVRVYDTLDDLPRIGGVLGEAGEGGAEGEVAEEGAIGVHGQGAVEREVVHPQVERGDVHRVGGQHHVFEAGRGGGLVDRPAVHAQAPERHVHLPFRLRRHLQAAELHPEVLTLHERAPVGDDQLHPRERIELLPRALRGVAELAEAVGVEVQVHVGAVDGEADEARLPVLHPEAGVDAADAHDALSIGTMRDHHAFEAHFQRHERDGHPADRDLLPQRRLGDGLDRRTGKPRRGVGLQPKPEAEDHRQRHQPPPAGAPRRAGAGARRRRGHAPCPYGTPRLDARALRA